MKVSICYLLYIKTEFPNNCQKEISGSIYIFQRYKMPTKITAQVKD